MGSEPTMPVLVKHAVNFYLNTCHVPFTYLFKQSETPAMCETKQAGLLSLRATEVCIQKAPAITI